MRMRLLLKAGAVGPRLLASTVIMTLLVGPVLPLWMQLMVFYGGLLVLVLLVAGVGESWAVRVLFGACRLTELERAGLAPVLTDLCGLQLGPPAVRFCVARRAGAAAAVARGRRTVVASRELVYGVLDHRLPRDEALAVLAHAAVVARAGLTRQDPAIVFWSTPWRLLATLCKRPRGLVELAWRIRSAVFAVAIWQSLSAGDPTQIPATPAGVPGAVTAAALTLILAVTYVAPRCADRWETHVVATGDRQLVACGLGPSMAALLRRYPQTPTLVARIQVLDPEPSHRPILRVVYT
jgi:hypothetical protein